MTGIQLSIYWLFIGAITVSIVIPLLLFIDDCCVEVLLFSLFIIAIIQLLLISIVDSIDDY